MQFVIIGGNGFVGECLTKNLILKNKKVIVIARTKKNLSNNNLLTYIKGDIFNFEKINFKNDDNDTILIHLIGTIKNKKNYTKVNSESVMYSLNFCKKHNIKKIIFLSANYGEKNYLESKLLAEKFILDSGLDFLIIKSGLIFHRKRFSSFLLAYFLKFCYYVPFLKKLVAKVYPLPLDVVCEKIITTLLKNPEKKYLTLEELRRTE